MLQHRISAADYVEQLRSALEERGVPEMLCLYNDGSFFSDHELPTEARKAIYEIVAKSGCRVLMVESLPVFITRRIADQAKSMLKSVRLVVGIGLQTMNDRIRDSCIASPVRMDDFLQACDILRRSEIGLKVYLLLKPPFLTEDEAVADCVGSMRKLEQFRPEDITICPTRVANGTVVKDLFEIGLYEPPALTTIIEVLREAPVHLSTRVSLINVRSSDMEAAPPSTCPNCRDRLVSLLERYNDNVNGVDLANHQCPACHVRVRRREDVWKHFFGMDIVDRVAFYLQMRRDQTDHPKGRAVVP